MWKYLNPRDATKILCELNSNIDDSSRLFIGEFDFEVRSIPDFFKTAGFEFSNEGIGCSLKKNSTSQVEKTDIRSDFSKYLYSHEYYWLLKRDGKIEQ